jgi:hypothetical protein
MTSTFPKYAVEKRIRLELNFSYASEMYTVSLKPCFYCRFFSNIEFRVIWTLEPVPFSCPKHDMRPGFLEIDDPPTEVKRFSSRVGGEIEGWVQCRRRQCSWKKGGNG